MQKFSRWHVRVIPRSGSQLLMVKGVQKDYPDRWYLPEGLDKVGDTTPLSTALRILRDVAGLRLREDQLTLNRFVSDEKNSFYVYNAALLRDDIQWVGSVRNISAAMHEKQTIAATPRQYGNKVAKMLRAARIINPYVPKAKRENPMGVCNGGHVGRVSEVCSHEMCAGAPFRA